MRERKHWVDIAKGIGMCFIVLSHTGNGSLIDSFYSPFFLTIFFFLSGFFFKDNISLWDEIKYLFTRLFLPMIILGTINTVSAYIIDGDDILIRTKDLILQTSSINNDMWFIACLISCHLLYWVVIRINGGCKINSFLTAIFISIIANYLLTVHIIVLPFRILRAASYLLYFAAGALYCQRENELQEKLTKRHFPAIIFLIYMFVFVQYGKNEVYGSFGDIIISFLGIIILIWISHKTVESKLLEFVGRNTLIYYAFQSKVIRILGMIFVKINLPINLFWARMLITVLSVGVLIIPAVIIQKWFPFLIGKYHCKNKYSQ